MQLFYTTDIKGGHASLPESEARHCLQVLRHQVGDTVQLIDGSGGFYEAEIIETTKKACVLRILSEQQAFKKRDYKLHLIVAPTKQIDRFEWLLEKATEIGVDEISPVICSHSERRKIREDRLEKVVLAASKQSVRAYLPKLNKLQNLEALLAKQDKSGYGQKFIAHCDTDDLPLLQKKYQGGQHVNLMIGPEGDFSKQEIAIAERAGYEPISLGAHRLRTETAALMACHTIHLLNSI